MPRPLNEMLYSVADVPECIHGLEPTTCTVCLGKLKTPIKRQLTTVSKDGTLSCPVCGRTRDVVKFPTGKPGIRLTDQCRECRDDIKAYKRQGKTVEEAVEIIRRRWSGQT
jgi:uncharacterized Zn finger protein (UPF0148 family)